MQAPLEPACAVTHLYQLTKPSPGRESERGTAELHGVRGGYRLCDRSDDTEVRRKRRKQDTKMGIEASKYTKGQRGETANP
jgi:hypothetical protein